MWNGISCGLVLSSFVAAQTTWIVEAGNPNALPTLAAAVSAASDGDTVRIRHASEWMGGGLVLNKALHIIGDCPTTVGRVSEIGIFFGGWSIQVGAGKELVLANCRLFAYASSPTLSITGCAGRVLLQDLVASSISIQIQQSANVMLARVDATMDAPMSVTDSTVVCDGCTLRGAAANHETSAPSVAAVQLSHAELHCVGTLVRGGNAASQLGGWVSYQPGTRAMIATDSVVTMAGGSAFQSGWLWTLPPVQSVQSTFLLPPGTPPVIAGTSTIVSANLPTTWHTGLVAGATATIFTQSAAGSLTGLVFGELGDRLTIPGLLGSLWIDPQSLCAPLLGIQNGSLAWSLAVPLAPSLFGRAYRWQCVALLQGVVVLGTPGAAVVR